MGGIVKTSSDAGALSRRDSHIRLIESTTRPEPEPSRDHLAQPRPTPRRMPAIYLSHGAPPLADDTLLDPRAGRLVGRPAEAARHPGHLRALGGGAAHHRRDHHGPAGLRLLGVPRALLPGDVRRSRRAGPRRAGPQAAGRARARHPRRPASRAGPRRLRPAGRDVPGRRHPDAADLHADARPASGSSRSGAGWRRCATRAC